MNTCFRLILHPTRIQEYVRLKRDRQSYKRTLLRVTHLPSAHSLQDKIRDIDDQIDALLKK